MAVITTTAPSSETPKKPVVHIVVRNTAFMLGSQVASKILAFIFSVYVIRQLGDVHFGRYAAALAYVSIFAMLTDLGTSWFSVREMARQKENIAWMVPDMMALRAILSLVAIVIISLSAWWLGKSPDVVLGIFVASCSLLLYAFQGPLDGVMIATERLDFSSIFNLLNKIVFMTLGTILLIMGVGYIGLLIATLTGVLVMGLSSGYVATQVMKLEFERPDPRRWWYLIRSSFPFGVNAAAGEFARRFDTVFMSFVLTDAAVGWYNVPYNMILTMLLMAQSLAMAMYPTMVKEYDSGRGSIQDTVQRALRYLLLLSFPIAVGGTLLADQIILLLYGPQFENSISVMRILVWVLPCLFLAEILGRTSSTLHLENKAAKISVINAVISVILNLILITTFGVIGAAVALLITRLLGITLFSIIIGPKMLFKGNIMSLLRVGASGLLMGGVVLLLRELTFLTALPDIITLPLLIGSGTLTYAIAVLVLGAVSSSESRYMVNIVRGRLRKLGFKKKIAPAS